MYSAEVTNDPSNVRPRLPMTRAATKRPEIVPRSELVAEAYEKLRDWIITGRLAPGAPIIETDTAALLGVQRSHLRLALQKLQHMGFVVTSRIGTYSRTRVAPLTHEDVVELFTVLGAVEGLAARQAALLPSAARTALVRSLRKINGELLRLVRRTPGDYNRTNDLDVEFHRTYVQAGGGPRVLALHEVVKPQTDRYEAFYTMVLMTQLEFSVREHEAIIAAIESGDPDDSQHAVEVNWRNAADRFARAITTIGERGSIP
jgi:DNA-binding GntR family transcriptional regulator